MALPYAGQGCVISCRSLNGGGVSKSLDLGGLTLSVPPEADAWTAIYMVPIPKEDDPRALKYAPDRIKVIPDRNRASSLVIPNGRLPDASCAGKLRLRKVNQSTGGAACCG